MSLGLCCHGEEAFYKQKWELLEIAALQLFKNKDPRESQVSHNSWMLDINQQHHTAV